MVKWLSENGCYSVAMESTGVYWKPVFEAIEVLSEYSENIWVVNPQHMKNIPGRKSDVRDAEWIARTLKVGLLEKSFVPEIAIRDLREYSRLQRTFVQEQARYSNRTEKFLQVHGFKFLHGNVRHFLQIRPRLDEHSERHGGDHADRRR